MEENQNVSKNGWKRIVRKKWFFPAVYLTFAAVLLTGVLWYQNLDNQLPEASDEPNSGVDDDQIFGDPNEFEQDADPVVSQQEVVKMPVAEENQAEIVTKFYDHSADSADQEKALVLFDNKYYQSTGVDIASSDGESFEITASLSGTVTEVKEDPLLGHVIKIDHENDLQTYYASVQDVLVEAGAEVKQGDAIASAGRNLFGQASGVHVHFELRKDGVAINPEDYFNQSVAEVSVPTTEENTSETTEEENTSETPDENANPDASTEEEDASSENEVDDEEGTDEEEEDSDEGAEEDSVEPNTESSAAMANA
ncbi:M23 family metallopeptidase [Aquibacillus koreensis]|uniref:M23 family metallopeptidase n=1 Tax=Aquibacillus koreensis TaxID=279446 RepID=A0A9X3WM42_9BACI|nr:M23 family metallopeptidase [Aquibacillus koreensis]MCT2535103.1 M23 family metallopeptidase [Aquibacillus koreensis]MDC3419746.1 M23 family metallopeptidase [Aquibacillus koreensis]